MAKYRRSPRYFTVVAGSTKLNQGGDVYQADLILQHEKWDRPRLINDVALVRVDTDIVFNEKVQPIKLSSTTDLNKTYPVILSGWGSTRVRKFAYSTLFTLFIGSIKNFQLFSDERCEIEIIIIVQLGGSTPNDLQHIKLNVIAQKKCEDMHTNKITISHICTLTKAGEGACHVSK